MAEEKFYKKSWSKKIFFCIGSFLFVLASIQTLEWLYEKLYELYSNWNWNEPFIFAVVSIIIIGILWSWLVWFLGMNFIRLVVIKKEDKEQSISRNPVDEGNQKSNEEGGGLGEILDYWGVRTAASEDIKQYLKKTKTDDQLIISAIGFATLDSVLRDDSIAEHIVNLMIENHSRFKMVIIFPKDAAEWKKYRPDLKIKRTDDQIKQDIADGHKLIKNFIITIKKYIESKISRKEYENFSIDEKIELRYYKEDAFPRHFILQGEETSFVGSYLSHSKGRDSYLLRLRRLKKEKANIANEGLFNLFKTEAEHICKCNSDPILFDNFLKDKETNVSKLKDE